MDNVKCGQRINCNGVNGTVIGNRSTRNRHLVMVKMDNGFTLKLNAHTLQRDRSLSTSRTCHEKGSQGFRFQVSNRVNLLKLKL